MKTRALNTLLSAARNYARLYDEFVENEDATEDAESNLALAERALENSALSYAKEKVVK